MNTSSVTGTFIHDWIWNKTIMSCVLYWTTQLVENTFGKVMGKLKTFEHLQLFSLWRKASFRMVNWKLCRDRRCIRGLVRKKCLICNLRAVCYGALVSNPCTYLGGYGFISHPWDMLLCLRFFVIFPCPSSVLI